jgi:hypothetical protein
MKNRHEAMSEKNYGVKRTRCIVCNELTHSGWNLGYPDPKDDKKWIQGRHCFKCSRKKREEDPFIQVSIGR